MSALRASALTSAPPEEQLAGSSSAISSRVVTTGPEAAAPNPQIGWDLTLHPKGLNDAYWRERASKHSQWDFQVRVCMCCTHGAALKGHEARFLFGNQHMKLQLLMLKTIPQELDQLC